MNDPFERHPLIRTCLLGALALLLAAPAAFAQEDEGGEASGDLSGRELRIKRRQMKAREDEATAAFKNAETAFLVGEYDKAIEEFLAVAKEYDDTSYRMRSVLRVGDVYYRQKKYERAISYYQRALRIPAELWWPEDTPEAYARADYMIGVSYYDQQALNPAFAHFRGFVKRHPQSRFVDRAYDFIGRGNMAMERYGQAIEAFRRVGTARLQKSARGTVSPGEELYVRLSDEDVGLATKGLSLPVVLTTTSGDREIVDLESLGLGSPTFLGMIKTRLGAPRLTESLDKAFSQEVRDRIDQSYAQADAMDEEVASLERDLNALKDGYRELQDADPEAEETQAREAELNAERAKLQERLRAARQAAQQLRQKAYAEVDRSYGRIEAVLAEWDVGAPEAPVAEADADGVPPAASDAGSGDGEEGKDNLSDVFTPEQITSTRESVPGQPTTGDNFRFRLALLSYWHQELIREYKTLDLSGADTITVAYLDEHGAGDKNQQRLDTIGIASDGRILCVGPDLQSRVNAVILGDEVRVKVVDADMDRTPQPDTLSVVVSSLLKAKQEEAEPGEDEGEADEDEDGESQSVELFAVEEEAEEKLPLVPEGAPSVTIQLTETGEHTGAFIGTVPTIADNAQSLTAKLGLTLNHIVRVAYQDQRPAAREGDWVVAAEVELVPGSEGEQEVIEMQESKLDRRSELEKGVALGKLARVYQDLGLKKDAGRTFDEALKVVKKVVRAEGNSPLGEEATYQMWDLYFASGDEEAAAEACAKLIASFPDSPLADDALLIMGKAEKEHPNNAIGHFGRLVSRYPDSPLAPEAQYRIADLKAQTGSFDVSAFETCANRYPGSNYAANSLLRLAEYYIENKDYARAMDYLERVILDFPDFDQLDKATYMRGICAYRLGDVTLSYTLMHEVVEKYPGSASAKSAGKLVEVLARKLKQ